MSGQKYIVAIREDRGADSFEITTELGLSKFRTFADHIRVWPIGEPLTLEQKAALGMLTQAQHKKNTQ